MRFKGPPDMLIRDIRKKKVYRFDKNGVFETEDPKLIKRMTARFKIISGTTQNENFSTFSDIADPESYPDELAAEFVCQKCGKVCKSALGLRSHMKGCKGVQTCP